MDKYEMLYGDVNPHIYGGVFYKYNGIDFDIIQIIEGDDEEMLLYTGQVDNFMLIRNKDRAISCGSTEYLQKIKDKLTDEFITNNMNSEEVRELLSAYIGSYGVEDEEIIFKTPEELIEFCKKEFDLDLENFE